MAAAVYLGEISMSENELGVLSELRVTHAYGRGEVSE
jgi:hypothetical protein